MRINATSLHDFERNIFEPGDISFPGFRCVPDTVCLIGTYACAV